MQNRVITISRQYGSGGRKIGELLALRLGIPYYDSVLIELAAKQSGLSGGLFKQPEQSGSSRSFNFIFGVPPEPTLEDRLYLAQYAVIRELAQKGSCVIVGRGAGDVLKDVVPLLNVFVYSDLKSRKQRAIDEYGDPVYKIEERIATIDKKRTAYFQFYAGVNGRQMENYHLCINSSFTGIEGAVTLIETTYLLKMENLE